MYVWWPLRINFCTLAIFLKFTIRVENICTRNVSLQLPLVLEGANLVLEGANFRCVRRWELGRTIRACSVWSRPWWPHRAQYITLFFISISLYTMLDWNSNHIYLTVVNLTFSFCSLWTYVISRGWVVSPCPKRTRSIAGLTSKSRTPQRR